MKQHALALAAKGFRVFPIAPNAKAPPLLNGWPQKATSDPAEIESFWLAVPNANIGIHASGMVVLDVDPKRGGNESLERIQLTYDLPATLCANTPSGGSHHYYRLPEGHAGVPNAVDALGPGLDTRSTGGYVVAPGSVANGGSYSFADPAREIALAPDWLVSRLGVGRERVDVADLRVPDAADAVLQQAHDWLARQAPAVQGQGGDARTFAVACGLRDFGASRDQALALLERWNEGCSPPWAPEELRQKVTNAYRYAENEAGIKAVTAEDFPVVTGDTSAERVAEKPKGSRARTLAELAAGAVGPYIVKDIVQLGSHAVMYGAPGEGKTFIALDMAYHVAAGLPWMGRKVHGGPVLYLAYEGQGGMVKRARALRQKFGTKDVPMLVDSAAYNLRELPGRAALGQAIAALPAKPVLIVIDTFARALMGGDENSAQDVGAFNTAVAALIASTGACVLIVHHSGKDKSKGARGSSALLGAIDTEIEVDSYQVVARKQRDTELLPPLGFKLVPVLVGLDADGDELTSCVVEPAQVAKGGPNGVMKDRARAALKTLEEISPTNKAVTQKEWEIACKTERGMSRSTFFKAKDELVDSGRVARDEDGGYARKMT